MLGDIATLTGGTLISEDLGLKLENLQLSQLGKARQITVDKDHTTIVEGAGKKEDIRSRIDQLRKQIDGTDSDYDREKYQERLAKLSGGVAVISVGANTEAEMKQTKARIEDALHATRAAAEEGILPGGGVALLRCIEAVDKVRGGMPAATRRSAATSSPGHLEPIRQIADNSGVDGSVVADEVLQKAGNMATTPTPASTSTCSRLASSTRSRWCARPCRMPPASPAWPYHRDPDHRPDDDDKKKIASRGASGNAAPHQSGGISGPGHPTAGWPGSHPGLRQRSAHRAAAP